MNTQQLKAKFEKAMAKVTAQQIEEMGAEYAADYSQDFFIRSDKDILLVSGETGTGIADYYREFGTEFHPAIEALAEELGYFWEWEDAASAQLVKA